MEIGEYFLVIVVLLLVVSIGSAELSSENYNISTGVVTGGGAGVNSSNYDSSVVVGIISGDVGSDNYTNQLGVFYGLNVAPDDPIVSVNTASGDNITSDDVLCNANVNDNDGGTFTVETLWYLNGVLNVSVNYSSVSNGAFSSTLVSGNTTKHQNWSCSLRIYDGELYSAWGNSSNLTILNDVPVVTLTSPVNGLSTTDRTPTFNWTSSDADGDSLTYEINISLIATSICTDLDRVSISSDRGYVLDTNLNCLFDNNDYYIWKVRANDGDNDGAWTEERNISIVSYILMSLGVDDIYFGSLSTGGSRDTDEEGLSPFILHNNGTVFVNVSINASSLWEEEPLSSSFFRFKVDNVTGEEGAFDWLGSLVGWTNVPFTGNVVAISKLNYESDLDSAEVDIGITVPNLESPGIKSSTVVFSSSLGE